MSKIPSLVLCCALFAIPTLAADEAKPDPCRDLITVANSTQTTPAAQDKKAKKQKNTDNLVPLSLVICEVEQAIDTYQTSQDVKNKVLPGLATAEFDFKTVVDTKGTAGIGFYIFKLGRSYDKQTTNDVVFTYQPLSRLKPGGHLALVQPVSFQDELMNTIKSAAKAVSTQQGEPQNTSDPLIFKQLAVTVSYGVTQDLNGGINLPIDIVTITATLDRSKNNVQSVKLMFAPPDKSDKPAADTKPGS